MAIELKKHTADQVCFEGAELKRRRIEAGLSQSALAARLVQMGWVGLYQKRISILEHSAECCLSASEVEAIEKALDPRWPDI